MQRFRNVGWTCGIFYLFAGLNVFAAQSDQPLELWYSQPAENWIEALPVGNGHMGAMIYGKTDQETIQFNEDTLWTGHPLDYQHPGASDVLADIRRLLFEGKQKEAEKLAAERFMSVPLRQNMYQPMGQVSLNFENHQNPVGYKRMLNLRTAVSTVTYSIGQVQYRREIFASYPDRVIVIHLTADNPGQLTFTASLASPHEQSEMFVVDDTTLGLRGRVTQTSRNKQESKMHFEARLQMHHAGGSATVTGRGIEIKNADTVTLVLNGATNFKKYNDISGDPDVKCSRPLEMASGKGFGQLKKNHLDDYQTLFNRVRIDLGFTEAAKKETDQRIIDFSKGNDPHLATLLFQYGRYLLIASSRPGSQPANLQGLWNDSLTPAWGSKYTTNINAEMNYWPAELTNLSECHQPLFDMITDCAETGTLTAKTFYNCPGWVLHHNTDIWRGTAPINASNHGIWPTGGAWMCQHLWLHYAYTLDEDFLRRRAYPIMKSAAEFFVSYLLEDPRNDKGWLISGPSNSPENGGLVMGPAMDHQIIRNLFSNCIRASEILDIDHDFAEQLSVMRTKIAPNQIGRYGQLQEWLEDKDDPGNTHRHVSHLWGLHPGNEITRDGTPDVYAAAKKSLEFRGDQGTGWSMGWKINFWARLHDGDHAYNIMKNLLRLTGSDKTEYKGGGIYPNMFDAHPPFQIDGNFGAASGIAEMLMQSHTDVIELLPALPSAWPSGSVCGLRARGAFQVDIRWENGKLKSVDIQSLKAKPCRLQYNGKTIEVDFSGQQQRTFVFKDFQ